MDSNKNFSRFIKEIHLPLSDRLTAPQAELLFLFLIFCLSFLIRYIGLKFSFPLITYGDETTILIPVYTMTLNKTLNPNNFVRPNQVLYLLYFFYLNFISIIKTGKDFSFTFQQNQFEYYFYARILIASLGSLIPVVAYKIGKENRINYSIPAALLFAFFPVYVRYSHFVSPDIPITLFTLIIIFFSIRYIRQKEVKYLILATVFASINTAEKYPGVISLSIVIFSLIWVKSFENKGRPWLIIKSALQESLKFLGLYIITLYIIAPNIFIQYGSVLEQIKYDARSAHLGADRLGWFGNLTYYLINFLSYSNLIIILFVLLGFVGIVKTKNVEILPCFYGVVYWIILSKVALHWERWGLPMYTFPILLGAFGLGVLGEIFYSKRGLVTIGVFGFSLSMIWLILFSFSISSRMTYMNTEVAALQYSNKVGITEQNSIYENYTPFSPSGASSTFNYSGNNNTKKYILLSSDMDDRYYNEPVRYAEQIKQYEAVKRENTLIKIFSPTLSTSSIDIISWSNDFLYYVQGFFGVKLPMRFVGPTIMIYQVNQ